MSIELKDAYEQAGENYRRILSLRYTSAGMVLVVNGALIKHWFACQNSLDAKITAGMALIVGVFFLFASLRFQKMSDEQRSCAAEVERQDIGEEKKKYCPFLTSQAKTRKWFLKTSFILACLLIVVAGFCLYMAYKSRWPLAPNKCISDNTVAVEKVD